MLSYCFFHLSSVSLQSIPTNSIFPLYFSICLFHFGNFYAPSTPARNQAITYLPLREDKSKFFPSKSFKVNSGAGLPGFIASLFIMSRFFLISFSFSDIKEPSFLPLPGQINIKASPNWSLVNCDITYTDTSLSDSA